MKDLVEFTKSFQFHVFNNYKVRVVVTTNLRESFLKRYKDDPSITDSANAVASHFTYGVSTLMFQFNAGSGVIAHECWHAIVALMKWSGVKTYDNEFVAYHLSYLVRQVTQFLILSDAKFNAAQPKEVKNDRRRRRTKSDQRRNRGRRNPAK